ncbi:MAG: hypothetical protein GF313_14685 [Caldithrix sp.]|nr:hypothetical protein [Caldithrix sp.]
MAGKEIQKGARRMKLTLKYAGFALLVLLGIIIAFAPVDKMADRNTVSAETLIEELHNKQVYIQPDQLAHWIINDDPGYQILDIRNTEDYSQYHIPGNVHLPFEKLAKEKLEGLLNPYKITVLASNGNSKAAQAWVLLRQMGFENVYILRGGVNYWVDVFNSPQKPDATAANDEIFRYQFRKSAGDVMMGKQVVEQPQEKAEVEAPEPIKRIRRPQKKSFDEGC